jgi:hypothetical protein
VRAPGAAQRLGQETAGPDRLERRSHGVGAGLVAVTGSDTSRAAAWGVVHSLRLDTPLPPEPVDEGA